MTTTQAYETFLQACQGPGCPLCRAERESELRYLDRFFYELVNDYGARVKLRASLGFCAAHARLSVEGLKGKALGLAILYEDMLRLAGEELEKRGELPRAGGKCPACEHLSETRRWLLSDLSHKIMEPVTAGALEKSAGLCLPHLRHALEHLRAPEKRAALLRLQRQRIDSLRAELQEYIRKNDYRFMAEGFGPEKDSWLRAVGMVAGLPNEEA